MNINIQNDLIIHLVNIKLQKEIDFEKMWISIMTLIKEENLEIKFNKD